MEERRGLDGFREYCLEGSTRRRWVVIVEFRDIVDLINVFFSR